jgi:hypothetical protein
MRWSRIALAGTATSLAACSLLYDPARYGGVDAGAEAGLDASGLDAPDLDAPELDAPGPDAPGPDTPGPDAFRDDAWVVPPDAWAWDASSLAPVCPLPLTSLALPDCRSAPTLLACHPEGGTQGLAPEVAEALLGSATDGYRLGLLGNGVDVVLPPEGEIRDLEIARHGDDLAIVWATPMGAHHQSFRVMATGLVAGARTDYRTAALMADELTDLTTPAADGQVYASFRRGGLGAVASCRPGADCAAETLRVPQGDTTWVARGGTRAIAMTRGTDDIEFEVIGGGPAENANQNLDATERMALRGVRAASDEVFYTVGTGDGPRRLVELVESPSASLQFDLAGQPRVVVGPGGYFLANVLRDGEMHRISLQDLRCPTGADCTCSGSRPCLAIPTSEQSLDGPDLVDWAIENLDDYHRVAALLLGDPTSGTRVVVAMWDIRDMARAAPIVIGSGRLGTTIGAGRSLRMTARRVPTAGDSGSRIEVFVAALVSIDEVDHIFLSGLRLDRCSR